MLGSETAVHTDGLVGCFRGLVMNNEGKFDVPNIKVKGDIISKARLRTQGIRTYRSIILP